VKGVKLKFKGLKSKVIMVGLRFKFLVIMLGLRFESLVTMLGFRSLC
jgi:hypothetical protein